MTDPHITGPPTNFGTVVAVRFASAALPAIDTVLIVDWDRPEPLILDVHSHVDLHTARGIVAGGRSARH